MARSRGGGRCQRGGRDGRGGEDHCPGCPIEAAGDHGDLLPLATCGSSEAAEESTIVSISYTTHALWPAYCVHTASLLVSIEAHFSLSHNMTDLQYNREKGDESGA